MGVDWRTPGYMIRSELRRDENESGQKHRILKED